MSRARRLAFASLAALALAGVLLALRSAAAAGFSVSPIAPVCLLREITGIPCPLCGGTHAMLALASGDPLDALGENPLVAIVAMGVLAAPLLALAPRSDRLFETARARALRPPVLWPVLLLAWAFVIARSAL